MAFAPDFSGRSPNRNDAADDRAAAHGPPQALLLCQRLANDRILRARAAGKPRFGVLSLDASLRWCLKLAAPRFTDYYRLGIRFAKLELIPS